MSASGSGLPDRKDTLGIVGVGVMGGGIAANLLKEAPILSCMT